MTRGINRLTGADLRRNTPGLFADGEGLWLQVSIAADDKRRNRSWSFRYTRNGRTREMGLGSLNTISLVEARERARKCRQLLLDGIDPLDQRAAARAAQALENAKSVTFEECAGRYIAAHRDSWRNAKHAQQWPRSLATHVFPTLGKLPVATIDTALIMKALATVWDTAPATGSRVRGRIEAILDWATVSGLRAGDNPARWSGHLEHLLAAPSKRVKQHHAALPYREMPGFMHKLRAVDSVGARALEFMILTAGRRGEVLGARWDEIDFDAKCWTVPASRMKSGKEHRVPLCARALEILQSLDQHSERVFPLSDWTMRELLHKLCPNITVHGFRSSFMDWAHETTHFPKTVVDMALAHKLDNKVEAAYRRGDLFVKRVKLMSSWGEYCAKTFSTISTPISFQRSA